MQKFMMEILEHGHYPDCKRQGAPINECCESRWYEEKIEALEAQIRKEKIEALEARAREERCFICDRANCGVDHVTTG